MNSLYGAHICTGAAIGAYIRVDLIDITFRNSINRAFINAGTASGAIFRNFISHGLKFLFEINFKLLQIYSFSEKATIKSVF